MAHVHDPIAAAALDELLRRVPRGSTPDPLERRLVKLEKRVARLESAALQWEPGGGK